MLFDFYTAKNHKQLVRDAIAKANRALEELDRNERNLYRPDGMPRYTPVEEQEQRQRIDTRRQLALGERDLVISNAREVAESGMRDRQAQIDRIKALQSNPIARLKAAEAANIRHLVALWEDGFGRSSTRDIWAQVQAVTIGGDRDQQIAVCEVLQRRRATLQEAGQVTQLEPYDAAVATLRNKLQDSGLAREHGDHTEGLRAAEELLAEVRAQDHPIRVEENREKLRASGQYASLGDPAQGGSRFSSHSAPVAEFVEQD